MDFSLSRLAFTGWRYALVGLVVIAVGGYLYLGRGNNLGATMTIVPGDFAEQVSISGTVAAAQDVALGFAANGRIAGVYARVGQHVGAGAIIAQTENGDLAAMLAQKQAALAQARANLSSLQAGTRPEELAVASTAVTNAEAALVTAVQNAYTNSDDAVHNRADVLFTNPRTSPKLSFTVANATLQSLVEHERTLLEPMLASWAVLVASLSNDTAATTAVKAQTYLAQVTTFLADANLVLNQGIPDQMTSAATLSSYGTALAAARANVNTAATTLSNNIAALNAAGSTLALKQAGSSADAIAAQAAVVASAEADIRSAQAAIAKTLVTAPFDGVVTRMDAKVGEIVSPNTSEISLQSDGLFQIETYIPEVSISRVAKGDAATTTLDAYGPSAAFPSMVIAVDPAETVRDGVPTYKTTLVFRAPDARIRSGMTANVVIQTGLLHNAIVIPAGATGFKEGVPYVSVVRDTLVENRTVTVGASPALGKTVILSGLAAGDVVLLTPAP